MKVENDFKKIFLSDNAQIEGLIKITVEKVLIKKSVVFVRVDLIDNDGIELVRFGPREVPIGGNLTLNHAKMICDIINKKPGF